MMMDIFHHVSDFVWSEKFWLPPNTTWEDRISTQSNKLPNFYDPWTYPFLIAVLFIFLRFAVLNTFVLGPLTLSLGIKNVLPKSVVPNPDLEDAFRKYRKRMPSDVIATLAKKLQWTERKVERWLRSRLAMCRINTYTKFLECAWQFLYYSFAVVMGVCVLYDKPWLYDVNQCWSDYPFNKIDRGVWWYYMVSLGFYWSMTLTHFFETRRKDFYQMFVHHLVTISLLVCSFICNFTRVGTLILIVHDIADVPLQLSKMFVYLQWNKLCDTMFAFFSIIWIVTRCGVFPFWIVSSTLFYATTVIPMHPVYYLFNGLLCALAVLHYYWTYFILRIIVNTAIKGKVEDERSSSDEVISEGPEDNGVLKTS